MVDQTPARRGRPPKISAAEILEAIGRRTDPGWTMAGIASDLGVSEAALYYHFPTKQATVRALGDVLLAELQLPECDGDWESWLRAVALEIFELVCRYPVLSDTEVMELISGGPGNREIAESMLSTLVGCGFELPDAAMALVLVLTVASSYMQATRTSPTVTAAAREALLDAVDRESAPLTVELYSQDFMWDVRAQLAHALDLAIRGIAAKQADPTIRKAPR